MRPRREKKTQRVASFVDDDDANQTKGDDSDRL